MRRRAGEGFGAAAWNVSLRIDAVRLEEGGGWACKDGYVAAVVQAQASTAQMTAAKCRTLATGAADCPE
jgi:hypothetical protein